MSKYIDLDLAKSKIEERLLYRAKDVERLLDAIPIADVEPVRRCKDCSYFCKDGGMDGGKEVTYCNLMGAIMNNDDFCSCFEEKTDGKEKEE